MKVELACNILEDLACGYDPIRHGCCETEPSSLGYSEYCDRDARGLRIHYSGGKPFRRIYGTLAGMIWERLTGPWVTIETAVCILETLDCEHDEVTMNGIMTKVYMLPEILKNRKDPKKIKLIYHDAEGKRQIRGDLLTLVKNRIKHELAHEEKEVQ